MLPGAPLARGMVPQSARNRADNDSQEHAEEAGRLAEHHRHRTSKQEATLGAHAENFAVEDSDDEQHRQGAHQAATPPANV